MQNADGSFAHSNNSAQHSRLTDEHQRQMGQRGITLDTAEAAGLWSATAEQVADLLGFNPKSGAFANTSKR